MEGAAAMSTKPPIMDPSVCKSHEFIDRTLTSLVGKIDRGFEGVGNKLTGIEKQIAGSDAEMKASIAANTRDIEDLERRFDEITVTGIKLPKSYDTPTHGTKRSASLIPRLGTSKTAIGIGIGIAIVLMAVCIFLGVYIKTGSVEQAASTVRDIASTKVSPE
ncbi:MAG: hypothetical protein WC895_04250 [Candidatus Shapirobacteria bacterium]|jgi:hypothetical protein